MTEALGPAPEVAVTATSPGGAGDEEVQVQLAALQATVASLRAELETRAVEPTASARLAVSREPLAVTASLGVASAYVFRGANYFNRDHDQAAALVAPALTVSRGAFVAGWWSGYQASGAERDAFVRAGNGHEQDLYIGFSRDVSERVAVSGRMTGYWYPFSVESDAGADAALWAEPSLAMDVDAGVTWLGSAAWYQGVQDGIAPKSYAYLTAGAKESVAVLPAASMDLSVIGGFKAPANPELWPTNTVDVSLNWGLTWANDDLSLSPAGHLTWTNLDEVDAGGETLLWFGLDTVVSL